MVDKRHPVDIERARESLERHNFHVDSLLGAGAFGVVHSVTDDEGRTFAVKTTRAHPRGRTVEDTRKLREACRNERAILRALAEKWERSPAEYVGVVRVFSVIEADDFCHFVMERLVGSDLEAYVAEYPSAGLGEEKVRTIIRGVLRGLAFLHGMGVLHRDVKPENVFVEHDAAGSIRDVKLVDLGLGEMFAKKIECSGVGCSATTNTVVGSLLYRSPAVDKRMGYGADCDLWGAGNVLYYAATGGRSLAATHEEKKAIWENCWAKYYKFYGIVSEDVNYLLRALLSMYPLNSEERSAASILKDDWFKR